MANYQYFTCMYEYELWGVSDSSLHCVGDYRLVSAISRDIFFRQRIKSLKSNQFSKLNIQRSTFKNYMTALTSKKHTGSIQNPRIDKVAIKELEYDIIRRYRLVSRFPTKSGSRSRLFVFRTK